MRTKGLDAMLKEFGLNPFIISYSIGTHSSNCSPNVPLKEKVWGEDADGWSLKNILKGIRVGEHGLGIKVK